MERANDNKPAAPSPRIGRLCPLCGKPASDAFRPFCSKRCADVDLHRWLGGAYVVPGRPETDLTDTPDGEP